MSPREARDLFEPDQPCACGHPFAAHDTEGGLPCRATVHREQHEGDSYSYPCPCERFTPIGRNERRHDQR